MQSFPYDRVRITWPDHPCVGQCGSVTLIYYDRQHTGSSPDLLLIRLDDGRHIRALSDEVEPELGQPPQPDSPQDRV